MLQVEHFLTELVFRHYASRWVVVGGFCVPSEYGIVAHRIALVFLLLLHFCYIDEMLCTNIKEKGTTTLHTADASQTENWRLSWSSLRTFTCFLYVHV